MNLLENLNEQQKEAVTATSTNIRIVAGAGSGKTKVITQRIAYLITHENVYPNKILAITFTNKAANEMKDRIEGVLKDTSSGVVISTIHSLCVRILRQDIVRIGYPRNFTIIDTDDQKVILREAYKLLKLDVKTYSYSSTLSYISHMKCSHTSYEIAKQTANPYSNQAELPNVYEYYQKRLKAMMALDFDDLLLFTQRLLSESEETRIKWSSKFKYIHVDEFQDIDNIQYSIIKNLMARDSLICVVGDPDQTIYTWRGAQVDIIMNFHRDFKDVKTIILNQNYRSTPSILNGANALISNNKNRIKKELYTNNSDGGKITHFSAIDDTYEPLWIAKNITDLYKECGSYKKIAVLYRSNYLSRALEKAFLDFKLPYRIYGGIRFYERSEIKDALSYLRLLIQDSKAIDLAVKRVINVPKRGIGNKTIENIEAVANNENIDMYTVIKDYEVNKGKGREELLKLVKLVEECRLLVDEMAISYLLNKLLEDSGYFKMLQEDKEIERLENIKELLGDIESFEEKTPEGTLEEYLQMIALYTDKEQNDVSDYVQLMSIHAAKGLEFDYVFVYSLCEGIFPNDRSINEAGQTGMEEERRLAYVAFTRAKKRLFLSDSNGYSFILDGRKRPSRFIREIDPSCIEDVNPSEDTPNYERNQANASQRSQSPNSNASYSSRNPNAQVNQPLPTQTNNRPGTRLKKGDLVVHTSFGDGIILSVKDNIAEIAFNKKFGIKKLMATHPALTKK
ncbi:MAG: UvrD-helicase domain-containing protein [Erysipelotrichaceae bacterium]